jgi:hypothetical protein
MSGGIQLSSDMVNDLKDVIIKHDNSANDDLVFMQYMAAVTAFVLAHQNDPAMDKTAVLDDIGQFMAHVLKQVEADSAPPKPAEDAFGIWTPDQG